jgi:hypothetical protein
MGIPRCSPFTDDLFTFQTNRARREQIEVELVGYILYDLLRLHAVPPHQKLNCFEKLYLKENCTWTSSEVNRSRKFSRLPQMTSVPTITRSQG